MIVNNIQVGTSRFEDVTATGSLSLRPGRVGSLLRVRLRPRLACNECVAQAAAWLPLAVTARSSQRLGCVLWASSHHPLDLSTNCVE